MNNNIIFLDFETTGISEEKDYIIEIGAIKLNSNLEEIDRYHKLIKPPISVPNFITVLTGSLSDEFLKDAKSLEEIKDEFIGFVGDNKIIAHNAGFEKKFFSKHIKQNPKNEFIDSIELFALFFPNLGSLSLDTILKETKVLETGEKHRALEDASDLHKVFLYLLNRAYLPEYQKLIDFVYSKMRIHKWDFLWFFDLLKERAVKQSKENLSLDNTDDSIVDFSLFSTAKIDKAKILESLDKLPEKREGQKEYLSKIVESFDTNQNLMIQAGTGIGKTLAYLLPAFYYAYSGGRIVIATRTKNLQEQIMKKDIPLLRSILDEAKAINVAKIQGRENYICIRKLNKYLMEQSLFDTEESAYLNSYLFALANLSKTADLNLVPFYLKQKKTGLASILSGIKSISKTCLGSKCPHYKECHYYEMLNKAKKAKVLIANHALIFNWPKQLKLPEIAIFDEAHNLLDESIDSATISLSSSTLDYFIKTIEKHSVSKLKDVKKLLKTFNLELTNKIPNKTNYPVEKLVYPDLDKANIDFSPLREFLNILNESLVPILNLQIKDEDTLNDLTALIEEIKEVLESFVGEQEFSKKQIYWIYFNESKKEWRLNIAPIYPLELMEANYNKFDSVVLTSATLYDAKFMGFNNIPHLEYKINSPFNYKENMKVIFLKNSSSPWHNSFIEKLSNTAERLALEFDGRFMGLFSNLKRLNQVADILDARLKDKNFYILKGCKPGILSFFKNNPRSVILGSESCAEGVDIQGNKLISILIERMPIVLKTPVTRVRMNIEENWKEYELNKRLIKLKQWIGRLIRTTDDRGFVIIFDDWFSKQSSYTQNFIARNLSPMPVLLADYNALNSLVKDTGTELNIFL